MVELLLNGAILLAIIAAAWKLSAQLTKLSERLSTVEQDNYTLSHACEVAFRQKLADPSAVVIDPRTMKPIELGDGTT